MNAVVFDMDGVIFDSEALSKRGWLMIGDKYQIPDMEKIFYRCMGLTPPDMKRLFLDVFGEDFPYDQCCSEAVAFFHDYVDTHGMPIKEGAREMLGWLKDNDISVGLATSTRKETVLRELTDTRLLSFFDEIVTGDMLSRSKPAPDIYLKACEMLHVSPENTWAVEDSYNGIRSAYQAGMKVMMIVDQVEPDDEIAGMTDVVFHSMQEALAYFKGLK